MGNKRREIYVADCETDPFKFGRIPKPFIWGLMPLNNPGEFEFFDTTEAFVNHIKLKNIIIYAHNGGKFDWMFLVNYLNKYDEDMIIINGRLAKAHVGIAELRDSYNLFPLPLSAFQKQEMDYNLHEESERNKPANRRKIINYLKSDLVYLAFMLREFFGNYGVQLTLASTAMKHWKKISGLRLPSSNQLYFNKFKQYYYGGRCECFESGVIRNETINVYDINSAYPYAMLYKHPYSTDYFERTGKPKELRDSMFCSFEAISDGALPFKTEQGELTFPNDDIKREYHVTAWELKAALELKAVRKIKWIKYIRFLGCESFRVYVDNFFGLRYAVKKEMRNFKGNKESDDFLKLKAYDIIYKIMLNSLYGKFGANPENYNKYMIFESEDLPVLMHPEENFNFCGELGDNILGKRNLDANEQHFYNVATSASITGFVRAMLFRAIKKCDRVLYCDTDSIMNVGDVSLDIGKNIGQWKHEGIFDVAGIGGKKLYILKNRKEGEVKKASKGLKMSDFGILKAAMGGKSIVNVEAPIFSLFNRVTKGVVDDGEFKARFVTKTTVNTAKTGKEQKHEKQKRQKID